MRGPVGIRAGELSLMGGLYERGPNRPRVRVGKKGGSFNSGF